MRKKKFVFANDPFPQFAYPEPSVPVRQEIITKENIPKHISVQASQINGSPVKMYNPAEVI